MGGGTPAEWSQRMLASIASIEAAVPEFHTYLGPGSRHCILPYDELYTLSVDGVGFADWLGDLVSDRPLRSVSCPECGPAQER